VEISERFLQENGVSCGFTLEGNNAEYPVLRFFGKPKEKFDPNFSRLGGHGAVPPRPPPPRPPVRAKVPHPVRVRWSGPTTG
jgi:hypothetical protein